VDGHFNQRIFALANRREADLHSVRAEKTHLSELSRNLFLRSLPFDFRTTPIINGDGLSDFLKKTNRQIAKAIHARGIVNRIEVFSEVLECLKHDFKPFYVPHTCSNIAIPPGYPGRRAV
jgi:hypothetical protein